MIKYVDIPQEMIDILPTHVILAGGPYTGKSALGEFIALALSKREGLDGVVIERDGYPIQPLWWGTHVDNPTYISSDFTSSRMTVLQDDQYKKPRDVSAMGAAVTVVNASKPLCLDPYMPKGEGSLTFYPGGSDCDGKPTLLIKDVIRTGEATAQDSTIDSDGGIIVPHDGKVEVPLWWVISVAFYPEGYVPADSPSETFICKIQFEPFAHNDSEKPVLEWSVSDYVNSPISTVDEQMTRIGVLAGIQATIAAGTQRDIYVKASAEFVQTDIRDDDVYQSGRPPFTASATARIKIHKAEENGIATLTFDKNRYGATGAQIKVYPKDIALIDQVLKGHPGVLVTHSE